MNSKKYKLDDETWWECIRSKIPYAYRMELWYHDIKLSIKSWYQRLTKGYANQETWCLDYSISKWILPRLKHFRNNIDSLPPNLDNGYDSVGHLIPNTGEGTGCLTEEEWKDKLDKMIYAFEFILTEDDIIKKCYPDDYDFGFTTKKDEKGNSRLIWNDNRKPDYTYYNECEKKYSEGLSCFQKYFRHLWS